MKNLPSLTMLMLVSRFVVGCCGGRCIDQMTFEIHLAAGRTALDGGTLTICQSGACSTGTPVWQDVPVSGFQKATITLTGALSAATVTLVVTPDERTTIDAEVWPKGNRSVDHYDVRFVDAQGAALLDFSRDQAQERRDQCDHSCAHGAMRIWPTSPNGLTCTSRTCASGATYNSTVILPIALSGGAPFQICRNDVCSKHDAVGNRLEGSLPALVAVESRGQGYWQYSFSLEDDPAVLADGDLYRFTVTDFQQAVLATSDATATYTETFPNGPTCDPFPCRWATLAPTSR